MSADPLRLDELLESIADGTPIDWDRLAIPGDAGRERLLGHLRLVAGVAEVHRTITDDGSETETRPTASVAPSGETERWGHLLLVEKIGEGAFGDVYRARDPWLDREVALKLVKANASSHSSSTRIVDEARTLARVRHPNVVTVHGADRHDGRVGLWMDLVRGRTLAQIVAADGPGSAAEASVIGQDLCQALAAVHAAGLVHRDVKAQNVMRESGGRLVLMDFGAGGTPLYLAPEVLAGGVPTVASDIYAVGVLLYHLVTGRFPVSAGSIDALDAAHAKGVQTPLGDARPDLPDGFIAVVQRALAADPSARFASARELREALQAPARGQPPRRGALLALALVAVAALGLVGWQWSPAPAVPAVLPIRLVAVLPFENLSSNPVEQYLATGVAMELTARLADVGTLRAVPWTFTRRFGAESTTLADVVGATNADAVVEGAVQVVPTQQPGGPRHVRIRVQLYRAGTGALLWTDVYERDLGDFLALQSEIAQAIAREVNVVVARREMRRGQARRVTAEAMEDYLKARELLEGRNDITGALALFRRAVAIDPTFAEAYAGLAYCHTLQAAYLAVVPSKVALERSLGASNRAIELDPLMPEAYAARAFAQLALAWNWPLAEADFKRALELGPHAAAAHDYYSNYLTIMGQHDLAVTEARLAEDRAPLAAAYSRKVAWALYMARRYEEAITQLRATLTIEPDYVPARTLLGRAFTLTGRYDDAVREFEKANWSPGAITALARAGRMEEAQRLLSNMTGGPRPPTAYDMGIIYAALGDIPRALDKLEEALRTGDAALAHIGVDPLLDPLREDPRFVAILRQMKLAH